MRQRGEPWNHKGVHRVYRPMRLNLSLRTKRLLPDRKNQPLIVPPEPDRMWSMHTLVCGKRFRKLNVFDEVVRAVLSFSKRV